MASLTRYKTPGVYVEEKSIFPPSIAAVDTAIPAFIGYTEKAVRKEESLWNVPYRITSMLQFEEMFGMALEEDFAFDVDFDPKTNSINSISTVAAPSSPHNLYYAMQMFFANGGGPCYIVAVGSYLTGENPMLDMGALKKGIDKLRKEDEVTLIVVPEAIHLSVSEQAGLMDHALSQCMELQDRFTIMDVAYDTTDPEAFSEDVEAFRNAIPSDLEKVKYGAAYFPYLQTILNFNAPDGNISINSYTENGKSPAESEDETDGPIKTANTGVTEAQAAVVAASKIADDLKSKIEEEMAKDTATSQSVKEAVDTAAGTEEKFQLVKDEAATALDANPVVVPADPANPTEEEQAKIKKGAEAVGQAALTAVGKVVKEDIATAKEGLTEKLKAQAAAGDYSNVTGNILKKENSLIFNQILQKIREDHKVMLPSSSAMAGIYARVDNTRGVWKAPANVSVSSIVKPNIIISDKEQESLNVDVLAGKSINVIRSFPGRGNLVWGARTLAGNDNEWRYLSVRRFFNFVEESVKNGTQRFVFEPNDANTWVKVRAMIENFLNLQWRAGALAGPSPESAFFVRVGLNQTMTFDDVLNGFMIVEIGMAVVRPAEFIILRFSHKMQES